MFFFFLGGGGDIPKIRFYFGENKWTFWGNFAQKEKNEEEQRRPSPIADSITGQTGQTVRGVNLVI